MGLTLTTTRRVLAAIVAIGLILLWAPGLGFGKALANTTENFTVGGFEIDGNFYDGTTNTGNTSSTPVGGNVDWVNLVSGPALADPIGNADTTSFTGSKECSTQGDCNPDAWSRSTSGLASPKDDISNVYVASRLYPDNTGHLFAYLGIERAASSGTTFFDFELNQLANHTNGTGTTAISVPTRSYGDLLIVAQEQGNGSFDVSATFQKWSSGVPNTTGYLGACDAGLVVSSSSPNPGCWTAPADFPANTFAGVSNDSTITNLPSSLGTLSDRLFAEMSLDLTAAGAVLGCPSTGFTTMNARTRSAISDSAEIKDYASGPIGIPSACGELKIYKYGPDGSTAAPGATFSVTPAPNPSLPGQTSFTDGGTGDADGVANGVIDIVPASPGTYTVTETSPPPGYLTASNTTSVTVHNFDTGTAAASVSFNDPLGSITIHKTGNGGALAGSTFTLTGPNSYSNTVFDAVSGTNADGAADGTLSWTNLKTGTYTLHEVSAPQGYDTVADQTFVIQDTASDAHHGPNLTVTINDPKHQAVMQVEKVAEANSATKIAGAVFNLYQNDSGSSVDTSTALLIGSCTTGADGTCTVGDATHVITWDHYYWWKEISVPAPYNLPTDFVKLAGHVTQANVDSVNTAGFFSTTTFADPQSGLVTDASDAQLPNALIGDFATLSGLNNNASGTITFTVYPPSNPTCDTSGTKYVVDTLNVTGNGRYPASGLVTYTATTAGTWKWIASYSGDANGNLPIAGQCSDTTEWSTVSKANPTIATTAVSPVSVGAAISDSATVSGGSSPTGTVTFTLYGPAASPTCTAGNQITLPAGFANVPLVNGVATPGVTYTPTQAGSYYWIATYSGDSNNNSVSGTCGASGETSVVNPRNPSISTTATTPITVGGSISDTASLNGAYNPTGTISFALYGPSATPVCTNATRVTLPASFSDIPVANGGASSPNFTPSTTGSYYWIASYSGDVNNSAVTGTCGDSGETSVVNPKSPSISTTATESVSVGGAISDTATLSGAQSPTGTISFALYGPSATPVCTEATQVALPGTFSGIPVVNGGASSPSFTPSTAGSYYWIASYSGDVNNNAVTGTCGDFGEMSVVNPRTPGISTSATATATLPAPQLTGSNPTIQDVATLTGETTDASGTVTFNLYGPSATADCTGTAIFTSTVPLAGGQAVSGAYTVTAPGHYWWTAAYSGDVNNGAVTEACGGENEDTVVTQPNLSLVKTANPAAGSTVQPGQDIAYSVSIGNAGDAAATATLVDTLPSYVTVKTATISDGGVYDATAGTITWTDLSVAAGATKTVTYTVTVNADAPLGAVLHNKASVGSLTSTTDHQVASGAITIVKSVSPTGSASYGDTLTYTLVATAGGTLDQHNVVITDYIPGFDPSDVDATGKQKSGRTTYVVGSATCSTGCTATYNATTHQLSWSVGDLAHGASVTVGFKVTIFKPASTVESGIPATTIDNVSAVQSARQAKTPSNWVHTPVTAVLGVKVVRKPVQVLPFTGSNLPIQPAALVAMVMIGAGVLLTSTRRRRTD